MRVAISGSTGLIGGAVFNRLSDRREVVRLGRRNTCELQVNFALSETVAALDLTGCDAVVHCAGIVDEDFKRDPAAAYAQNTVGIAGLAERAVIARVRRLVYFSSTHVYGPLIGRISEQTQVNPLSDYAIAHYAAEQILRRISAKGGLEVLIVRPNAVFGVPAEMDKFDRWSLIPFSFPLAAVYREKIVLLTSGEQQRNFVSTDDLARLVEQFLDSQDNPSSFEIVNSIGPETLSVYEFALKCAATYQSLTGRTCAIERPEPSGGDAGMDFQLVSSSRRWRAQDNLDNFLISFISRLLGDLQHGTKYGA